MILRIYKFKHYIINQARGEKADTVYRGNGKSGDGKSEYDGSVE